MPEVVVQAARIAPTTGATFLDREIIESLPLRNGSVNDIIGIVPSVQFSEDYLNAFTAGEITPPTVSISGSRFYDNNYTIDGLSNNSPLDPASDAISDSNKLSGHPQIHFLNPRLIEQIAVYNSNVPAEFGNFTGGLVKVETLTPTDELWGEIAYKTTDDELTDVFIDPANAEDYYESDSSAYQPEFRKQDFGAVLNIPLNRETAAITGYQQISSEIPLLQFDSHNTQSRKREDFFAKVEHWLPGDGKISLTTLHSPTTDDYFLSSIKDSDYLLKNNNTSLIAQTEHGLPFGRLNLTAGYTKQISKRTSDETDRYFWSTTTASIDWEGGREGGLGHLETGQDAVNAKTDLLLNIFTALSMEHQLKTGMEANHSRQYYQRPETNYVYYSPSLYSTSAFTCSPDDPACIEGEQYLSRRTVYNKADSETHVNDYAFYLQDSIVWKRLELFPGIRISYEDYTENHNLAPRFSSSLDLFGDRQTILFFGRNRYYSGTLITQALYQSIVTENQVRTTSGTDTSDWQSSTVFLYERSDLETPYTDETTVGVIQQLFGGELKLQYLEKKSRKEFARGLIRSTDPEPDYYVLNNYGRSDYQSVQASWQRTWRNHFFEINGSWQEATTTHTDYDTAFDAEDLTETIWYEGEEIYPYEIPKKDFNRPIIVNLIYSYQAPFDVQFTNVTRYRGPYSTIWRSRDSDGHLIYQPSEINPEQGDIYVYEKRKSHGSLTFDWHLSWKLPMVTKQELLLTLDILNVFNKRLKVGYETGDYGFTYETGRQIWAGTTFRF